MAYILNIETATKNCSVSIGLDGQVMAVKEIAEVGFSHAEKLHVFFEEILAENNLSFNDLAAVAVSQGPGSYTGLRIGVSAAKGLCFALDIPLIAIETLETLVRKINIPDGVIIPMIDARRMECYTAIYDKDFNKIRDIQAEIIDANSYNDVTGNIHIIGDGAHKCEEVLNDSRFFYHDEILYPSAQEMVALSFLKHKKSDFVDVAYFEPFYLKDFMMTVSCK